MGHRIREGRAVPLNKQKGNMYSFVTHTWNPIKGLCKHDCRYCYMKRYPLKPLRLDKDDLNTDLGIGNKIFVGSSTDMFEKSVPAGWIRRVLEHCRKYTNKYLFQSKNPGRFLDFREEFPLGVTFCTTLESNRMWLKHMGRAPDPKRRAEALEDLWGHGEKTMVTIEPIMDFDLGPFVEMLKTTHPGQVNIGADTMKCGLPNPPKRKTMELIGELEKFSTVHIKDNLYKIYD